jgi:hypothetical protein
MALQISFFPTATKLLGGPAKPGWGPRSIQVLVIAIGVPAVVILGREGILNNQAVAAILGGIVGFEAGTAARADAG